MRGEVEPLVWPAKIAKSLIALVTRYLCEINQFLNFHYTNIIIYLIMINCQYLNIIIKQQNIKAFADLGLHSTMPSFKTCKGSALRAC